MPESGLRAVLESRRSNAVVGWLLVTFLALAAGHGVATGNFLWAGFTLVVVVLAIIPAAAFRDAQAMLPWEVLFVAALPVIGRTFVVGRRVDGVTLTGRIVTYFAVAAIALIVAVELDVFTPVRMNYPIAVLFVVVTTMAMAGLWAIVKWSADVLFGTAFLLDGRPESVIETALMWDFVAATVVGLVSGAILEHHIRKRVRETPRVSETGES